jgi:UvrD/REP helicase N-terminal domain/UvrD-like helicase C-terminal domain
MSATFTPTEEQQHALALFQTGASLAIEAGAGTGKTTALRYLAESTDRQGQYVAFNKAIVEESKAKMPATVACNTAHSLAFRGVGRKYAHRLNDQRMRSSDIARILGITSDLSVTTTDGVTKKLSPTRLAGLVMETVRRFCQSADAVPDAMRHAPYIDGIDIPPVADGRRNYANNNQVRRVLQPYVLAAWNDLQRLHGRLQFKHDHYLKLWQLDNPRIAADFILFDEAQDANPVMVAAVAQQTHAQLVWVGDSQQQIYSFTGALNALAQVPAEQRAFLTQSFRFGQAIADVANICLDGLDAELRLTGTDSIPSTVGSVEQPDAILTRTNAEAIRNLLAQRSLGRRPFLVGGGGEFSRFARGAADLQRGARTSHPDLACFDTWAEVQTYVMQDEQGSDLRLNVRLIDEFGVDVILAALDRMPREQQADLVISTAHKSKGREWGHVRIGNDFPPDPEGEELRLLYVACTRAQLRLDHGAAGYFAPAPAGPPAGPGTAGPDSPPAGPSARGAGAGPPAAAAGRQRGAQRRLGGVAPGRLPGRGAR